jgi:hypothetical protein
LAETRKKEYLERGHGTCLVEILALYANSGITSKSVDQIDVLGISSSEAIMVSELANIGWISTGGSIWSHQPYSTGRHGIF